MSVREGWARASGLGSTTGFTTPRTHDSELGAVSCWSLGIEAGPVGNIVVVRLAADLDMLTLPLGWAAVITALDHHPTDLVVDLSEVGFCGVRGFALLAAIARVTAAGGIGYTISGLGRHHERGANLSWTDQQIARARNTTAAVTAMRAAQARRSPRSPVTTSSRHAGSRRGPERAAVIDGSPYPVRAASSQHPGDPDGGHPPVARRGRLRRRLLGAAAVVWSSVSGTGSE
jgi:anti-anti-sigma regulatory factor